MEKDYLYYTGNSSKANWVIIYDQEYHKRIGSPPGKDMYPWNVRLADLERKEEMCIRVLSYDVSIKQLPPLVREASHVVRVEMPSRFIPYLQPDSIPTTVETLEFSKLTENDEKAEFPKALHLPFVKRVSGGELFLEPSNFPELTHLEISLDRKRVMLDRLPYIEKLRALGIGPCPNNIFSSLENLKLGYLYLNTNLSLETLHGIEKLETVTDLVVNKWTKLTDLTALKYLPLLESLTISYCKRIQIAEPLLEISNLKSLFVWACNNKALKELSPKLEKRKLQRLSIS